MNLQEILNANRESMLEFNIERLSNQIDLNRSPIDLNQTYNIILYYNKKVEYNNTAELMTVEKKLCTHYNNLNKIC